MEDCNTLQERGGWWEDILVNRCRFPIAPINTFTNISYIIAGALCFILKPNLASAVFAAAMIFLGIGSALYHGTKEIWASRLDNAGMYAVFSSLVTYALSPNHPYIFIVMLAMAILSARLLAYGTNWKYLLNPIMGIFVCISIAAVALNGILFSAIASLLIFLVAYFVWWMDKTRRFTLLPKWGHGLWHVLTAEAFLILFMGIR